MSVIALCLLGLMVSAAVAIDSIGTQKKLRSCIYAGLNVLVMLGCAWKMTDVTRTVSEQKSALRENARSQAMLERSAVRLAQAVGASGSGAPTEVILSALGKVSERQLGEMAAADRNEAVRFTDRDRVLQRLVDVYAGETGDLPHEDQDGGLPPLLWMNEKLEEHGFGWRVKSVSGSRAETVDVAPPVVAQNVVGVGTPETVSLE